MNNRRRIKEDSHLADDTLTYDILAYLAEHPEAEDTLEGIVHWWLLEQKIKNLTAGVEAALDKLVAQGLVLEHRRKDGRIHYRLNRRKAEEIEDLLECRAKQGPGSP